MHGLFAAGKQALAATDVGRPPAAHARSHGQLMNVIYQHLRRGPHDVLAAA